MKTKYISDLDFGIDNPTPIIFVCDKPAEDITNNLNDEYLIMLKKYLKKFIPKEIFIPIV